MRVIAGSAKGRRLRAAPGMRVRPTADKVKGAVFSMLGSRFDLAGITVLDLFAGSGTLGIEALSRGAGAAMFVEQSRDAARLLQANLDTCGFAPRADLLLLPVERAISRLTREGRVFDGVLLDPPYGHGLVARTLTALAAAALVRPNGWVVVEHHVEEAPAAAYGSLRLTHTRRYGTTCVALFQVEGMMADANTIQHRGTRAVYAGSFDPFTKGHLDVVQRAMKVFDQVIVAVATNTSDPAKDHALFSAQERLEMIRAAVGETGDHVIADTFSGLLVDYCDRVGASVIIRGLRAVSDFEYEFQMAMMNHHLKPHIETFFMTASEAYFYTASRLVKEVAALGGDVRGLLPDVVLRRLHAKLGRKD